MHVRPPRGHECRLGDEERDPRGEQRTVNLQIERQRRGLKSRTQEERRREADPHDDRSGDRHARIELTIVASADGTRQGRSFDGHGGGLGSLVFGLWSLVSGLWSLVLVGERVTLPSDYRRPKTRDQRRET
jgi:hypothetical protein